METIILLAVAAASLLQAGHECRLLNLKKGFTKVLAVSSLIIGGICSLIQAAVSLLGNWLSSSLIIGATRLIGEGVQHIP